MLTNLWLEIIAIIQTMSLWLLEMLVSPDFMSEGEWLQLHVHCLLLIIINCMVTCSLTELSLSFSLVTELSMRLSSLRSGSSYRSQAISIGFSMTCNINISCKNTFFTWNTMIIIDLEFIYCYLDITDGTSCQFNFSHL